ncbi:MAG: MATE family efflux transporter [Chloroflexi bacterium]|nr:MATE family efflux transporter [Chloroflexota bacterium]
MGMSRPAHHSRWAERDWTKGSVSRNLWLLAWPMMIGGILNQLGPTIDMIWVGKLGPAAMAGVGVSGMAVMVANSLRMGLSVGTRALVARFIGAGDTEQANHAAQQTLVVSVAFATTLAIIGIFLAETILKALGLEPDVVRQGAVYMRIQFVGSVTMSLWMMAESTMQASGDSVNPMRIVVSFRLLHMVLSPLLIFGWGFFPQMGISGAATANIIAQGIGGSIGMWVLLSGRSRLKLSFKNFRFDGKMVWRLVKIGLPASITGAERTFANLMLMWFVVPFGTVAVAAHSLIERVDTFVHMPVQGLSMAAGVLAGQNLGAHQPERAEKTGWQAAGIVTIAMLISSGLIWLWAEYAVRLFNSEPELVEIASTFLRIQIVNYLVFGFVSVLMQCLNTVGDTMIPMLTTLLSMWLVQVPTAFVLSRFTTLGVYGVRWGIVSAIVVRAGIYSTYFKLGRWKGKKV